MVIGRKSLIGAGHVTTQNLGGKKSVWLEGWQSVLTLWVSKPRAVAENYLLYRGLMWNFAVEECYIISAVSKI